MREIIFSVILIFCFVGLPLFSLIWFCRSLYRFIKADKTDSEQFKKRKLSLILSSILLGILVILAIALMILISLSVAHM